MAVCGIAVRQKSNKEKHRRLTLRRYDTCMYYQSFDARPTCQSKHSTAL